MNELDNQINTFEKLLKPIEVANFLNISRAYAYQLLKKGEIPTVHIGNAIRVRPDDLQRYIIENLISSY